MNDKPATLATALLHAAHENARTAFSGKDSKAFHSRLQAAVQVGSSIEYLLKFLLVSESPLLVAEVRPSNVKSAIQARIALSRDFYGSHLADVKSCSVDDAFLMVQEVLGLRLLRQTELLAVTRARNAAIHLAVVPDSGEQEDNLCTMISAFEYAFRNRLPAIFSMSEREVMRRYVERRMEVRYEAAEEKVRPAKKEAFGQIDAGILSERMIARQRDFLDSQAEHIFGADMRLWNGEFPTTRNFVCMRCGRQGIALCWAEGVSFDEHTPGPREIIEEDGDGGVGLYGMAFACSWCGLTLTSNELLALDSKKDPWAASLMEPHPMTEEQYVAEPEPYTVKLLQ